VRMKAVCVLESISRKEDEPFSIIASYYSENRDVLIKCAESPQASLREKSNKVLSLLVGEQAGRIVTDSAMSVKVDKAPLVQMPDLIDTGDPDDILGTDDSNKNQSDQTIRDLTTKSAPLIYDLLGDNDVGASVSSNEPKDDEDPFADVSFHSGAESRKKIDDIFTGMTVDDKNAINGNLAAGNKTTPTVFDLLGSQSEVGQENQKNGLHDLMAGLSVDENMSRSKQNEMAASVLSEAMYVDPKVHLNPQASNDASNRIVNSQMPGISASAMAPFTMPNGIPPGMMFNPALSTQQINYAAMGNFLAQQQLLATMSNFQQYGNLNTPQTVDVSSGASGGYSAPPLPDIFQANFPGPAASSMGNMTKKEETKAFDFISDHLTAARDSKRVV
ncbi:hypothetical protein CRG98_034049, partial [Punica granatum]